MERNQIFISLKIVAYRVPTVLSIDNGDAITSPYYIANTFNNYFASIAGTTKKKAQNIHIKIFQTIIQMKVEVQYFCNILIKKK